MRRRRWRAAVVFLLIAAAAQPSYASTPFSKLGRGLGNIVTGWLEIPVQIMQTTESQGSFAGTFVGSIKGLAFGIGRTLMGAFETVTFILPNHASGPDAQGEDDYGPIIEPEFVIFRSGDKL